MAMGIYKILVREAIIASIKSLSFFLSPFVNNNPESIIQQSFFFVKKHISVFLNRTELKAFNSQAMYGRFNY
jgi:hypothetical protein